MTVISYIHIKSVSLILFRLPHLVLSSEFIVKLGVQTMSKSTPEDYHL